MRFFLSCVEKKIEFNIHEERVCINDASIVVEVIVTLVSCVAPARGDKYDNVGARTLQTSSQCLTPTTNALSSVSTL